ncbi:MAG TPA: alpha/beta hydrolase [Candidatus Acidoferrales bacterium]|nr:alpha/beta hydrolase [Candidatus Acidoferrales bacterium]
MKRIALAFICSVIASSFVLGQQNPQKKSTTYSNSVYQISQGFIDANGVMIYYEEFGKGKPLVIVRGGPGASHDHFLPYLIPLARDNRLIFIDESGSGRSQQLEDSTQYSVENMVEDVEAIRRGSISARFLS